MPVNLGKVYRALDALVTLSEVARRLTGGTRPPPPTDETGLVQPPPPGGLTGQIETRLTNVLVAALKEAFDRDHARLDLERAQLEEQRQRAETALRLELRRQSADREIGRLRLLAGTALAGWIAAVGLLVVRLGDASVASRVVLAAGMLLLLGSLAAAFTAQGRISESAADATASGPVGGGTAAPATLWLLVSGLAATAVSLLW
jgi:hypothetical protein